MAKIKTKVNDYNIDKTAIFQDYTSSDRFVSQKRATWDDKEDLFFCRVADAISLDETKSQIHDPRLSTYILERSGRVTSQLPRGRTRSISKSNRGKSKLMNLVLDKWILPKANSQFPLLTKLKLMQIYSNVYGASFGLVDWIVDKRAGYVGPDLFLVPIRDVFPQIGAVSLEDSDYINISTLKTKKWLEERDPDMWENIDNVLEGMAEEKLKGKSRAQMSKERISTRYSEYYSDDSESKDNPYVEVVTRYERDKWITFLPDQGEVIRVIDNPHKNDRGTSNGMLPVIAKYNFPVLEDFFGLGDFERSEDLQKSLDSLINLYFDGVKMSLFPPLQINTDGVTPSTIKMRPGAKWFVDRPNLDVQATAISPRGLETFTGSYQYLLSALQNSQGTSETNIPLGVDSTQGKTPQALKMQSSRENVRDSMERYQMEQTVSQMIERFVNLQASKMSSTLVLSIFDEEIDEIAANFPDIVEIFSDGDTGKITINKGALIGKYIYKIDNGSMSRKDDVLELENLKELLRFVTNGAQIDQTGELVSPALVAAKKSNKDIDVGEIIKRIVIKSGTEDWDKIVIELDDEEVAARAKAERLGQNMDQFIQGMGPQGQTPTGQQGQPQPQSRPQI